MKNIQLLICNRYSGSSIVADTGNFTLGKSAGAWIWPLSYIWYRS